jgi:hypothetical protein
MIDSQKPEFTQAGEIVGKRPSKKSKPPELPALLSMEQIMEHFYGQSVLMKVTARADGAPSEGIVLAVGTEEEIETLWLELPRNDTPGKPYYRFWALPPMTEEEWIANLEDAERELERLGFVF